jgi:epoxyqueuosine reductase
VLDARRCLSYLSQSRLDELPFAAEFEDRVYGCDICQDVCPWNRGAERRAGELEPDPADDAFPRLADWLESEPEALAERYRRLYVPDRDGRHLQRNARVAFLNEQRSRGESAGRPARSHGAPAASAGGDTASASRRKSMSSP